MSRSSSLAFQRSRRAACLIVAVVLAGLVATGPVPAALSDADSQSRAVAILEAANAAMRDLGIVSYDFVYTGAASARARLTGSVLHDPPFDGKPNRYRATLDFTVTPPQVGASPVRLELASDGERIWRHDLDEGLFEHGSRNAGASYLAVAFGYMAIPQLLRGDRPLGVELDGLEIARWAGTERVGDVLCDVVFLSFPDDSGLGDQYLSFGRDDRVLRRIVLVGSGLPVFAFSFEITGLRMHRQPTASAFTLAAPAGVRIVDLDERDVTPGHPAPSWTLTSTDGETLSLDALRGRVVVMDFWATWCPFCAANAPELARLAEDLSDRQVSFVGLNFWETGDPTAFSAEHGLPYPTLVDAGAVAELYKIGSTPATVVVGRDGSIAHVEHYGPVEDRIANLRRAVLAALADGT